MRVLSWIVLASLLAPAVASAGGFNYQDFGARRCGMMAVVGRPDDLTAIFHNPAGLAGQRGSQVYTGGTTTFIDMHAQLYHCPDGVAGCDPSTYVLAPEDRMIEPTRSWGVSPFVGASSDLGLERFTFAAAAYAPNFYAAYLPNEAWDPARYAITEGYFVTAYATAAAAYRATDWLDVGLGLSYMHVRIKSRRAFNVLAELDPEARFTEGLFQTDGYLDARGVEHSATFGLGVLARPVERLRLGASFTPRRDLTIAGPLDAALNHVQDPRHATQRTTMIVPTGLRAGVNVELVPPRARGTLRALEWGLDVAWWDYSAFQRQRTTVSGDEGLTDLLDLSTPEELRCPAGDGAFCFETIKGYRDAYQISGGFLAALPGGFDAMVGMQYDTSPSPDEYRTMENANTDLVSLAGGGRWQSRDGAWRLSATFIYGNFFAFDNRNSLVSPPQNAKGDASHTSYQLDATRAF